MINLRKLIDSDAEQIVSWNMNQDEKFLHQWAGKNAYNYPIDTEQILFRNENNENELFTLDFNGKILGTIELGWSDRDNRVMRFGRLLIGEKYRGMGYGKLAIEMIEEIAFNKYKALYIELGVFEFNHNAKGLYEKLGYTVIDTKIDPKDIDLNSHTMRKKR